MLHAYSAVSAPSNVTWVVDTGASYDVVPAGLADEMGWERLPRTDPVGINTANGRIFATPAVMSQIPGMPEHVCAAEMQSSPSLIFAGRRCLNHGYSSIWRAGKNPHVVSPDGSLV